jgi:hypothetical protein
VRDELADDRHGFLNIFETMERALKAIDNECVPAADGGCAEQELGQPWPCPQLILLRRLLREPRFGRGSVIEAQSTVSRIATREVCGSSETRVRINDSSVMMHAEDDSQNDESRSDGEKYGPAQPRRYSSIIRRRRVAKIPIGMMRIPSRISRKSIP